MRRRRFLAVATVGATTPPAKSAAQEPRRVRRVAVIGSPQNAEALREGLRELGYHEGVNLALEHRSPGGSFAQLASIAAEIVRLGVEVIVVGGSEVVQPVMNATSSIPIVMTMVGDPVELGLVRSLSRPGGNITGLSTVITELAGKWIELLREADPRMERVGVLWNPPQQGHHGWVAAFERAAEAGRVRMLPLPVEAADGIEPAILAGRREQATGLVVLGSTLHYQHLRRIADAALQARMAAIAWTRQFVASGGLMAYGASDLNQYRRAATYVDKILKGAKPGDLPVEQPTQFDLSVNLGTAKALGVTIPPSILARVDEVIE